MGAKLHFVTTGKTELRAYVTEHCDYEEVLHAYLNKLHTKNQSSRIYQYQPNHEYISLMMRWLKQLQSVQNTKTSSGSLKAWF
jgi:hypothetical protein